jgi:hypothetical protein
MREYRKGAIYRITIAISDESSGDDGNIRAAREMVTVATRQQGFISLTPVEHGGKTTGYELYWANLESIDIWRSKIYESALNRYGRAAWQTFESMSLDTIDIDPVIQRHTVGEKIRSVFSLVKSA